MPIYQSLKNRAVKYKSDNKLLSDFRKIKCSFYPQYQLFYQYLLNCDRNWIKPDKLKYFKDKYSNFRYPAILESSSAYLVKFALD